MVNRAEGNLDLGTRKSAGGILPHRSLFWSATSHLLSLWTSLCCLISTRLKKSRSFPMTKTGGPSPFHWPDLQPLIRQKQLQKSSSLSLSKNPQSSVIINNDLKFFHLCPCIIVFKAGK